MKTKLIAVLSSVLLILSSVFVFGACSKDEDIIIVNGISEMGSKLYSRTRKSIEELAKIDVSSFNDVRFTDVDYTVGFVDNSFNFFYNLGGKEYEDYFANTKYSPNNASITLDKSYPTLTLEKMKEKYKNGYLTTQYLEDVAQSGHLENVLYHYRIDYDDKRDDRRFYCSIEAYIFKSEEQLHEAAESGLFFDATFIPFHEGYTYHENVLIRYFPYPGTGVELEIVEPTDKEINKIKSAINKATDTIKDLIRG